MQTTVQDYMTYGINVSITITKDNSINIRLVNWLKANERMQRYNIMQYIWCCTIKNEYKTITLRCSLLRFVALSSGDQQLFIWNVFNVMYWNHFYVLLVPDVSNSRSFLSSEVVLIQSFNNLDSLLSGFIWNGKVVISYT